MFSDYHTHTLYSNHGEGHPREMAALAVERGMLALGFSEHFPLPRDFTDPAGGTANMHWDQIDDYVREVREAQAEFGHRIKLLLGFELDYLPAVDEKVRASIMRYPADYYVGSVHIVDRFRSDHENWLIDYTLEVFDEGIEENGGPQAVYTRYYQLISDYALAYDHQIVGHLDLIKKFNKQNRLFDMTSNHYLSQVEATLDVLKRRNKIIEVNTNGLHKWIAELYPSDPILQMILERRIPVCLSSDAHRPHEVGRDFSSTWQKLLNLGFEELTGL